MFGSKKFGSSSVWFINESNKNAILRFIYKWAKLEHNIVLLEVREQVWFLFVKRFIKKICQHVCYYCSWRNIWNIWTTSYIYSSSLLSCPLSFFLMQVLKHLLAWKCMFMNLFTNIVGVAVNPNKCPKYKIWKRPF